MKNLTAIILAVSLLGISRAPAGAKWIKQQHDISQIVAAIENPPASHVSFVPFHVFIDPHGKPLACYQIEIMATAGDVNLVGIEGGDSAAFNKAPYYDPRALQQGKRIIIGAYSLAGDLPAGNTRVATLMVRVAGTAEPRFAAKLQVAATTDATAISASVSVIAPSKASAGETATASTMGGPR